MACHGFNPIETARKAMNEPNIKDLRSEMRAGESSGGRGRRFKSSHPDQVNQLLADEELRRLGHILSEMEADRSLPVYPAAALRLLWPRQE